MNQNLLDQAKQQHQAGNLAQAQSLYRRILVESPRDAETLHLLGFAIYQSGNADSAIDFIKQAIDIDSSKPAFYCNLGVVLASTGRHDEAIAAYRQALLLLPTFLQASYNLAGSLHAKGDWDQAIEIYHQVLSQRPDWIEARNNLGNALLEKGEINTAIDVFRAALSAQPNFPEALFNLGNALQKKGDSPEAINTFRQAIAARPDYSEAYNNLGNALIANKQSDEAIAAFRRAIVLRPNYADACGNLGSALEKTARHAEAVEILRKAVALKPDLVNAWCSLGGCLQQLAQVDDAIAAFQHAIALKPDLPSAHYNLSMLLLKRGNLAEGFSHYQWRWNVDDFTQPRRKFSKPAWDGSELGGKHILLHAEQGFGDAIQFARFAVPVAQRGGKVILECPGEVMRLFHTLQGVDQLSLWGHPEPEFDVQCSILDVPRLLHTTLQTIPAKTPYLWFDPALAEQWRKRMADQGDNFKVGLFWAGRPKPEPERSVPPEQLAPLGNIPGVRFYSLQRKGDATAQSPTPPKEIELIDWTDDLKDFADTAALMANLDVIITIDSAVAHLAGALGKRTWVLLRRQADWRWLMDRTDSPWYPTARLFRQRVAGNWAEPIAEIAQQLKQQANR